ncbi:MAG TPA: hypothetical protein VL947_05240, partial [Cytophagales bacterium]|nr:hypothetical protein [Cytophagales bacterium]
MKFLFIVQTDGRGHISQAMALADILEAAHHNVVHVLIGKSHRIIPEYLLQRFHGRYTFYDSPNFAYDASGKGLDIV